MVITFSGTEVPAVMFVGAILFVAIFVLIAPQSRTFLFELAANAGTWTVAWAPFSYLLLLILVAAAVAGMHVLRSAPPMVVEGNPMAKYRKDESVDED
jgi:hypothetical protein